MFFNEVSRFFSRYASSLITPDRAGRRQEAVESCEGWKACSSKSRRADCDRQEQASWRRTRDRRRSDQPTKESPKRIGGEATGEWNGEVRRGRRRSGSAGEAVATIRELQSRKSTSGSCREPKGTFLVSFFCALLTIRRADHGRQPTVHRHSPDQRLRCSVPRQHAQERDQAGGGRFHRSPIHVYDSRSDLGEEGGYSASFVTYSDPSLMVSSAAFRRCQRHFHSWNHLPKQRLVPIRRSAQGDQRSQEGCDEARQRAKGIGRCRRTG